MEIPKNIHPVNYTPKVLPIIIVQDFHGHQALMHIKHRRWMSETSGKAVYRDWI